MSFKDDPWVMNVYVMNLNVINFGSQVLNVVSPSFSAVGHGVLPFLYVFFLGILLVHRTFRDEEKCSAKYGEGWKKYCKAVPYRFIPYLV